MPEAPSSETGAVKAWDEPVVMRTYLPAPADRNPMFLEKRVYQGSSGRVYPMPFIDRISAQPHDRPWRAIHLENEFLRIMILPELGGRIQLGLDKTNGYDFFYRQNVIKPALVGLAGPWISGGVEFNWPQHHRPATFMPVDSRIEREADGSVTVWCSQYDPMTRMKGMHGVTLHPGKSYLEVKVRLFNRTPLVQTFLWWANAAVRVHEQYQSFFPPDVGFVADHARRAITRYPLSDRHYYGVDYAERARSGVPADEMPAHFRPGGSYPPNDLSWYANIPVPTSYMIVGSEGDFFGGYDHARDAGVVHVANHHIAPGKKQWTWGNHEFGYAWDRNLTDTDGPYIELMAGVYTDNQPDFSFLAPFETKTFSQFWYPIRAIGAPLSANLDAALSVHVDKDQAHIGVCVTRALPGASIILRAADRVIAEWKQDLSVGEPFLASIELPKEINHADLRASIEAAGTEILAYQASNAVPATEPQPATAPPLPHDIHSNEELYLTGLHLEQYRHATRSPEIYWREAVRRDPGDSRSNNALGMWHLRRGELAAAESQFRVAIARLTERNANPRDGEPYYNLGLALRFQNRRAEAYAAFSKATWNAAWRAPAHYALACSHASLADWPAALDHARRSLAAETENLNARNLMCMILRKLGRDLESQSLLNETTSIDPLDAWSQYLISGIAPADNQQCLDLAFDLAQAGFRSEAKTVLRAADRSRADGSVPMISYALAHICEQENDSAGSLEAARAAEQAAPDYCFPSRIEEQIVLESALRRNPSDARAAYYLGNLYYDRRRHEDAIALWERSTGIDQSFPTVWRNLGIAYFNVANDVSRARDAFERAHAAGPSDARILYERDQLWKQTGESPENRLAELEKHRALCDSRDDLTVERAVLLNQAGEYQQALSILLGRHFQPWEGGEGLVLGQYVRSLLSLGTQALSHQSPGDARRFFIRALLPPENLGEAKHLLANQSDIWFWIGAAYSQEGLDDEAADSWNRAAGHHGDFQGMSVRAVSGMTFWSALAMRCMGATEEARQLFQKILDHADQLEQEAPSIDYFATSLPAMLLFESDIAQSNRVEAMFLRAQALLGHGRSADAEKLLSEVLKKDRNHLQAMELLRERPLITTIADLES
jgi:tetratricopeptide (TPR) repeat protein